MESTMVLVIIVLTHDLQDQHFKYKRGNRLLIKAPNELNEMNYFTWAWSHDKSVSLISCCWAVLSSEYLLKGQQWQTTFAVCSFEYKSHLSKDRVLQHPNTGFPKYTAVSNNTVANARMSLSDRPVSDLRSVTQFTLKQMTAMGFFKPTMHWALWTTE